MFRRNLSQFVKTIPISHLHPPKTGIDDTMAHVELSGTPNLQWLSNLPKFTELLDNATKFPNANEFWQNTPTVTALETVASSQSYFEILKIISEHGFFFLIPKAILARDAPLPHVAYEDIMKALMTCSMQRPPEEQFQLPGSVLRLLLCTAAHHILHDKEYFLAVETWFRRHVERQQTLGSEAWSAWVMCCVAANKCDSAIMFLKHMEEESKIEFDPVVFNFMLHPSEIMMNEKGVPNNVLDQHVAKGFIAQQRLLRAMQTEDGVVATGIHAMFVYYAITRQTVQQWETIRIAIEQKQKLSERTIKMILNVFAHEKGKKCGPLTMKALVKMFAARKDMLNTCFILATARQREVSRAMAKMKQKQQQQNRKTLAAAGNNKQQDQSSSSSSNLDTMLEMSTIPIMRFPKHEEKYILECFSASSHASSSASGSKTANANGDKTFKEREFENHFPLLKKLVTGDRKPFSDKEEEQLLLVSSSSNSSNSPKSGRNDVLMQHDNFEDDLDVLTNLILNQNNTIASQSVVTSSSSNNTAAAAAAASTSKTRLHPKFASPQQINEIRSEFSNPTTPDTRNAESMIHFAGETVREQQRERFYETRRATAWINRDGENV